MFFRTQMSWIIFAWCALSQTGWAATSPIIGKVAALNGKAWITRDSQPKVELQEKSFLHSGDILSSDQRDFQMKISLADQEGALLVKGPSMLQILRSAKQQWAVDLVQGSLLSFFRSNPKEPRTFQVRAQKTLISSREGAFFLKSEPKKDLFLCACQGTVAIENKVILIGKNHDVARLISEKNLPISARIKKAAQGSDHSQEELKELARLSGSL